MLVAALLHPLTQLSWASFSIHRSTVAGIVLLGALYLWRASRAGAGEELSGWRKLAFFCALLVVFFSLNGPVHDLSDDYLFSAHMVQHLLLTMLMPPLMLAGLRGWMIRPVLSSRITAAVARFVTKPALCFVIFNLVIAVWHIPLFYNAAMADHNIHILEHLMFMGAAVLMWWPLMSPLPELPRLPYPGQMLYCFLLALAMSITAIYIAMADRILYPWYSSAPRVFGLSPMEDQVLGGLIMWVPGGLIFTIIITVVFFRWAASGEDDAASAQAGWVRSH